MPRPEGFFDAELLTRIAGQELTARRIIDGFLAGKNRSNRHGFSVEFVEHREYSPGDDLRHLDWKVLGRLDRFYIKRYEEETNITAMVLLDVSASMTYGSGSLSKFELGAFAASGLGYLLHRQRDAVGLALYDQEVRSYLRPSVKRVGLAHLGKRLMGCTPSGKSSLHAVVQKVTREMPHRALFVVISDFFVPLDEIRSALKLLEIRGHDAIILHTLDEAERTFPFRANTLFRGLEDSRELLAEPHRLRERYLQALERFLREVRRHAEACAFDYSLLSSEEPLGPALAALLAARTRVRRRISRGPTA